MWTKNNFINLVIPLSATLIVSISSAVWAQMPPPLPGIAPTSGTAPPIPLPPQLQLPLPNADTKAPVIAAPPSLPKPGAGDVVAGAMEVKPVIEAPPIPTLPEDALKKNEGDAPKDLAQSNAGSSEAAEGADAARNEPVDPESLRAKMNASPNGIVLPPPIELPPIHVVRDRKKTWMSDLKPVVKPRGFTHNYKNQIVPAPLSAAAYDRDNEHLPIKFGREDMDRMFLESVAANDINGTRALLDAGVNPNLTNTRGETPRALAQRLGAVDTARLLQARGAR